MSSIIIVSRPSIIERQALEAATKRSAMGEVWYTDPASRWRAAIRWMRSTASTWLPSESTGTPISDE